MISFETERLVEWGDCDPAGIVFYPNFYRFMDGHYHQFLFALSCDHGKLKTKFGLLGTPLRDSGCTFHAPAYADEEITLSSQLVHLGTSSLKLNYTIKCEDRLVAEGFELRVAVAASQNGIEKRAFPEEVRNALLGHLSQDKG
ncbi:MAG: thioesterase family protein [Pseudomonadota bacterium]